MVGPMVIACPLPGVVGETKRVSHLVVLPDRDHLEDRISACCGASFGPGELELLDRVQGMPCELCLARAPLPAPEQQTPTLKPGRPSLEETTGRLAAIERGLITITEQVAEVRRDVAQLRADLEERNL